MAKRQRVFNIYGEFELVSVYGKILRQNILTFKKNGWSNQNLVILPSIQLVNRVLSKFTY